MSKDVRTERVAGVKWVFAIAGVALVIGLGILYAAFVQLSGITDPKAPITLFWIEMTKGAVGSFIAAAVAAAIAFLVKERDHAHAEAIKERDRDYEEDVVTRDRQCAEKVERESRGYAEELKRRKSARSELERRREL